LEFIEPEVLPAEEGAQEQPEAARAVLPQVIRVPAPINQPALNEDYLERLLSQVFRTTDDPGKVNFYRVVHSARAKDSELAKQLLLGSPEQCMAAGNAVLHRLNGGAAARQFNIAFPDLAVSLEDLAHLTKASMLSSEFKHLLANICRQAGFTPPEAMGFQSRYAVSPQAVDFRTASEQFLRDLEQRDYGNNQEVLLLRAVRRLKTVLGQELFGALLLPGKAGNGKKEKEALIELLARAMAEAKAAGANGEGNGAAVMAAT
jgi:hypothetical protein